MEAELGLLEEVQAALARADALGAAGDIYQGLAQAVGGLVSWLRATAAGPRMVAQARHRAEGLWTGGQARSMSMGSDWHHVVVSAAGPACSMEVRLAAGCAGALGAAAGRPVRGEGGVMRSADAVQDSAAFALP